MKKQQAIIFSLILVLLLAFSAVIQSSNANPEDFDGDGFSDLVVGVPFENTSAEMDAGSVSVLYGTTTGLTSIGNQYWMQDPLIGGPAKEHDHFGNALAIGDFNNDGLFDLAVGVPGDDVGDDVGAGAVNVIYGSSSNGLDMDGNQYWHQESDGIIGVAETDDSFGSALTTGDFDGDGYDDLVVGVPQEDIKGVAKAGAVNVIYGSTNGLTSAGNQVFWQVEYEIADQFGKSLAAGDFDRDGYDDLAVGVPREDVGIIMNAGTVDIFYGSANGLVFRDSNDIWHQDRQGIENSSEESDWFGEALTTGDFNSDGYVDLAVGVPGEDTDSPTILVNAGAVNVLYGSVNGITNTSSDYWHQDVGIIEGACEEDDRFGFALTAGDFDGDGFQDLAIGVPYETFNAPHSGIAQVLYGTADGLTDTGNQLWSQESEAYIYGAEEEDDLFGFALAAGNYNGDGYDDLAVGVPFEDIGDILDAGAVNVFYGSSSKLTVDGNQLWYQGNVGVLGSPEEYDYFGYSLAAIPKETKVFVTFLPLAVR